jgi:hypothetical protein
MKLKIKAQSFNIPNCFSICSTREITAEHAESLFKVSGVGAVAKSPDRYKITVKAGDLFDTQEVISKCTEVLRYIQSTNKERLESSKLDEEISILDQALEKKDDVKQYK